MSIPFTKIDKEFGFPEGLLASMWQQESTCGLKMVSPKGARGHFQFMPETRPEVMAETGLDPWTENPEIAARCAAHYLRKQQRIVGGDLKKAIAAYNAGCGTVLSVSGAGNNWLSMLSRETQNYVPEILGRIGFADRIDFTNRYTGGKITDKAEIEREKDIRRNIYTGVLGMPAEDVSKMNDVDLLGVSFLGMIAAFIKGLMEIFGASQTVSAPLPTPVSSRVAAVVNAPLHG